MSRVEKLEERWFEADLHRLRGEAFLASSADCSAQAESCYRQALAVARSQSARLWELRATVSLAHLWRDQGKRTEARDLLAHLAKAKQLAKGRKSTRLRRDKAKAEVADIRAQLGNRTLQLAQDLESLTRLETRVTILGHLQRGGTPSAADRLLATRLGTACARLISDRVFGVMVAARGDGTEPVALDDVVGKRKVVPPDHPWIRAARDVGVSLGDA